MPTLKTKYKLGESEEDKFVGVYVSQQIYSYLMLYTVAVGITKSVILRELIESWKKNQSKHDNEESLIKMLISKINMQWKIEKSIHHDADFATYKDKLNKELKKRGMSLEHIDEIINKITDGKN
jgi:hypothetical protein